MERQLHLQCKHEQQQRVNNVADPLLIQDAATKAYVDAQVDTTINQANQVVIQMTSSKVYKFILHKC